MLTLKTGYFCFVFLLSGSLVSLLQLLTLPLWLTSRATFRRLNARLAELYWTELLWLVEWHAGFTLDIRFDSEETLKRVGKESAVVLANHGSDIDWLLGWVVAHKLNILGGTKCLLKQELARLPVLGWSWWFLEYTFLSRNWEKDRLKLERSIGRLRDFPIPYWVVIYAEGTRKTEEKLKASQEFCRENNLPVFNHVMYPRTKGWTLASTELNKHADAVYMFTLAFPDGEPTIPDMLGGRPKHVQAFVERCDMKDVPVEPEGNAAFCVQAFGRMDQRLTARAKKGNFDGVPLNCPPKASIWQTYYAWAGLIGLGLLKVIVPWIMADYRNAIVLVVASFVFKHFITVINTKFSRRSKLKAKSKRPSSTSSSTGSGEGADDSAATKKAQ